MPAHFRNVMPVLVVETVAPTRDFFCNRLGFAPENEVAYDGVVGFVILRRAEVRLMVQSAASLQSDTGEHFIPGPYRAWLYVTVDNVDLLVPEIADADIVLPPRKTPYGRHEIGVREPGGNIIVFASRLPR